MRLNATTREMGPMRPKYMVKITMKRPSQFNFGESECVNPTVVDAPAASYRMSVSGALLMSESRMVAIRTTNVVVLMPPAVPTGEPPINIRMMVTANIIANLYEFFHFFRCCSLQNSV